MAIKQKGFRPETNWMRFADEAQIVSMVEAKFGSANNDEIELKPATRRLQWVCRIAQKLLREGEDLSDCRRVN